ncbi:MAG: hypothetical protein ISR76_03775 [Planctomycetes bacterium]|nr:hypothetical protein [Planctomycetota bacterium]
MSDSLRTLPLVLVSAVLASAVTAWILQRPPAADESELSADALRRARLERDSLRDRLAELERSRAIAVPADAIRSPVLDDAAIQRAVDRWMLQNPGASSRGVGGAADEAGAALAAGAPVFEDVDSAFAALLADGLDFDRRSELWQRIGEAGLTDAVLEALEQQAEDHPGDPQLQLVLGEAYLEQVFQAGNSPQAGAWAMKADAAFDLALQADPGHWDARFTKAVSLSNWPPFLGKQNEAIRHFELLVDKQGSSASRPSYADTYLILGNLYQQTGRPQDALRVWRLGAGLFPGRQDILDQIAAVDP